MADFGGHESKMEFPYKAQDLGGITFGFMELDFPYPPQDLGGITFGFMEESQSATPTIIEEEIKVERVPVEIDWNPWVSPRPSKCSRKEESQRATMVKQGLMLLQFDGVAAFTKASCGSLPALVKQSGGGRARGRPMKTSQKALFHLKRLCNKGNERNLKEDGPYGQACGMSNIENSKKNRKKLQSTWLRKKGKEQVHSDNQTFAPEKEESKDYKEIGNVLRRFVKKENTSDISPSGPYAKSAIKLGLSNTRRERLNLYVTWRENRGNVKISDEVFTIVSNDNFIKKTVLGKRKNFDHNTSDESSTCTSPVFTAASDYKETKKQTKKETLNQMVFTGHSPSNKKEIKVSKKEETEPKDVFIGKPKPVKRMKKVHCICESNRYNWWHRGDMIQCCQCLVWFHYQCLGLKKLAHHEDDSFIFECGLEQCPSNIFRQGPKLNKKIKSDIHPEKSKFSEKKLEDENELNKEQFLSGLNLTRVVNSCEKFSNTCLDGQTTTSSVEPNIISEQIKDKKNRLRLKRKTVCDNVHMSQDDEQVRDKKSELSGTTKGDVSPLNTGSGKQNESSEGVLTPKKMKQTDNSYTKAKQHSTKPLNTDSNEIKFNAAISTVQRINEDENTSTDKSESLHDANIVDFIHESTNEDNNIIRNAYSQSGLDCFASNTGSISEENGGDMMEHSSPVKNLNDQSQISFETNVELNSIPVKADDVEMDISPNIVHAESSGKQETVMSSDQNILNIDSDSLDEQQLNAVKIFRNILNDCHDLVEECDKLTDIKNKDIKKKTLFLQEMLTQNLEKLDAFNCCALGILRSERKYLVNMITRRLNKLDAKQVVNSEDLSSESILNSDIDIHVENLTINTDDVKDHTSGETVRSDKDLDCKISNLEADSDSDQKVKFGFSKESISSVLGCQIPESDFFTAEIKSTAKFELQTGVFDALYKDRKNRCFKRGSWQKYFVDGLKQSNPYCVFSFQHHQISIAENRSLKAGCKTFYTHAKCIFEGCPVNVNIDMFNKTVAYVKYKGNVRHKLDEQHARHIRGEEREMLKNQFKGGIKPLKKYLDTMDKTSAELLVAGNLDGIGKNSRVYSQIACESRQEGRKHDDTLQSLLYQQEDMKKNGAIGFIQKICAKPLYLYYWSEAGLILYHEKASTNTLFWDATGSVCRRTDDGKQMLYYELALKHPVKGKMGIPVTSMLSSDQSLPTICDWIRNFRHGEKKLFGFSKVTIPKMIISDQSMVFILAALQEFNNEDMGGFLARCWKIANGTASADESKKTLVHLCASHFMNSCKKFILKKIGKKNKVSYMYMIGLLMNCKTMKDAQELLQDIYTALLSPTINDLSTENIDRLYRKINAFEPSAESEFEFLDGQDTEEKNINPNIFTEEEYQSAGTRSKFREWSNNISAEVLDAIEKMPDVKPATNALYSPEFHQYLKTKLMPIFPLWSIMLIPAQDQDSAVVKTNSTIENRFRILKYIGLNGRSQHRIDEFTDALYHQTVGVQKLSCLESLKHRSTPKFTRRKISKHVKKITQETTEKWNKPKQQSINLKDKHGKYQKKPYNEIHIETPYSKQNHFQAEVVTSDFSDYDSKSHDTDSQNFSEEDSRVNPSSISGLCLLKNFGNTCWFNSMTQGIVASKFSKRMIEKLQSNKTILIPDQNEVMDLAIKAMVDLFTYMQSKEGQGSKVPPYILQPALRKVVAAVPEFTQQRQQDVHEFNTHIVSAMSEMLNEKVKYTSTEICNSCKKTTIQELSDSQSLFFPVIPEVGSISVQTLADNILLNETRTKLCSNCKKDQVHDLKRSFTHLPRTLFIILSRYQSTDNGELQKVHNDILVNDEININFQQSSATYQLKSAVCHIGESINNGHYTTVVKQGKNYICCDDLEITLTDREYMLDTAYIVIYDRKESSTPDFMKPLLESFSKTTAMSNINKDSRLKCLTETKKTIFQTLSTAGYTKSVADDIMTHFVPFIETKWNLSLDDLSLESFYEFFLNFLLNDKSTGSMLLAEYFELCSKHVWKCQACALLDVETGNKLVLSVKEFDSEQIKHSLKQIQGKRVLRQCKCKNISRQTFLTSLPSTFAVVVKDCSTLSTATLHEKIDVSSILPSIISDSASYQVREIVCQKDDNFQAVNISSATFKASSTQSLIQVHEMDEVFLFYEKEVSNDYFQKNVGPLCKDLSFYAEGQMLLPRDVKFPSVTDHQTRTKSNVKINKKFMNTICNSCGWLTSDNINVYFQLLLTEYSKNSIHIVDSCWFSQILLRHSNPLVPEWLIYQTESKLSWFDYDIMLVPINENNRHWTLVAIKIKEKSIIYCDSYSSNKNAYPVCFQILRYLYHESLLHKGNWLDIGEWSVSLFNNQKAFPYQTDGSSCGVYVCATARSIISQRTLPAETNLPTYRKLIASEISSGNLQNLNLEETHN